MWYNTFAGIFGGILSYASGYQTEWKRSISDAQSGTSTASFPFGDTSSSSTEASRSSSASSSSSSCLITRKMPGS
jgi:hypothetical protein